MKSLRFYLVIATLSAIILANFVAAVEGYKRSMDAAEALLDSQLRDYAELLQELTVKNNETLQVRQKNKSRHRLYKVIAPDNRVLVANSHAFTQYVPATEETWFYDNFAGARWRFFQTEDINSGSRILVAERADFRTNYAEQVALASITPLVFVIPIIGLAIWLVVQRALNSLKKLSNAIAERESTNLHPIRMEEVPEELLMLVDSTNQLLNRLAQALSRERRFTSDAAHELRTPMAALKVLLANHQSLLSQSEQNSPTMSQSLEQISAAMNRLHHMAEQLLDLHKSSAESEGNNRQKLELDETVRSVVANIYPLIEDKAIQLEISAAKLTVIGVDYSLRTLIRNIISNAIKYSPRGGRIEITIDPQRRALIIEDNGPGIPEEARQRIFDRFYRLPETEKDKDSVGCGLGLAIVKEAALKMDADVEAAKSEKLGGLKIQIIFAGASV